MVEKPHADHVTRHVFRCLCSAHATSGLVGKKYFLEKKKGANKEKEEEEQSGERGDGNDMYQLQHKC